MAEMVYRFRNAGAFPGLDAQIAGERLEQIRTRANGILSPLGVLDDARDETSPLHAAFEWDDHAAAEKHRERQAEQLIEAIVVTGEPERQATPAFVTVSEGPRFTSVEEAKSDAQIREHVLAQAMRELVRLRTRYRQLEELSAIFALIDFERDRREPSSRAEGEKSPAGTEA